MPECQNKCAHQAREPQSPTRTRPTEINRGTYVDLRKADLVAVRGIKRLASIVICGTLDQLRPSG